MIATAPFGNTGHESSRTLFGAAALGSVSHADAERTLDLLLEHGVNHIDTAASYGDSELRIASWLRRRAISPRAVFRAAPAWASYFFRSACGSEATVSATTATW